MAEIITGIDFDNHLVKIIQVKKTKEKTILLKFASGSITNSNDEEKAMRISQTIYELLVRNKIKPVNLHTCINRRFTTIRYLELPATDNKELAQMVKLQAVKFLPYPIQDLIIAFQIIGQIENSSQIILVIVHKDIINKHLEILKRINLAPEQILLSSYAIFNSYYNIHKDTSPIVMIDINSSTTEIDVINKGRLSFSRSSSLNLDTDWERKLINEIKISISAYNREIKNSDNIQKIILSGNIANLKGLDKRLAEALDVNVEISQPLKGLIMTDRLRKMYGLVEKNPQLATLIGLVIGDKKEDINLLPEDIKKTRKQKEKRNNLILTAALSLSLLLLLSIFVGRKLYDTYQYLNYLNKEITINLPLAKQVELKGKRLNAIKKEMINQTLSLEIIAEIYKLIPQEVSLNELIFEEDSLTILRGEAKKMSVIFSLITILEDSPYFKNVKVTYVTKRKMEEKEVVDFQITCPPESLLR